MSFPSSHTAPDPRKKYVYRPKNNYNFKKQNIRNKDKYNKSKDNLFPYVLRTIHKITELLIGEIYENFINSNLKTMTLVSYECDKKGCGGIPVALLITGLKAKDNNLIEDYHKEEIISILHHITEARKTVIDKLRIKFPDYYFKAICNRKSILPQGEYAIIVSKVRDINPKDTNHNLTFTRAKKLIYEYREGNYTLKKVDRNILNYVIKAYQKDINRNQTKKKSENYNDEQLIINLSNTERDVDGNIILKINKNDYEKLRK